MSAAPSATSSTSPGAEEGPDVEPALNIVQFTELGGRTRLELLVQCPSKELRDTIIDSGMETGMQEQMHALEELAISLR
jgi:uncharacterized protein YndB with AHSA1/START domain